MSKNRRFPFERTKEDLSVENFSTTEKQLYPMIREYASVCRCKNINEKVQHIPPEFIPEQDNYQLNQLIDHLKQNPDNHFVDFNDFSALRQHNLQRWKYVKYQWQKYYQDQIKKQQEIFVNLIKMSH